jgi:hypothetical protein
MTFLSINGHYIPEGVQMEELPYRLFALSVNPGLLADKNML